MKKLTADSQQLGLEPQKPRGENVTIVRNILVSEVTILLLPNMHQTYDDLKGAALKRAGDLAPRIVDLCERRLRGLPGCGACRDEGEVCTSCGLPEIDHGEADSQQPTAMNQNRCPRFNPMTCDACPFPELQKK